MCHCNPSIRTPNCGSEECEAIDEAMRKERAARVAVPPPASPGAKVLHLKPVAPPEAEGPEVSEQLVALLEEALAKAKSGKIVALAYGAIDEGSVAIGSAFSTWPAYHALLTALRHCELRLMGVVRE